ncbi:dTDP-4-dehydrorhamnose 3,5-epimerase [candidate division SR1 bacterium]|nr:dTDP-4-dehydrorhamnose 3,5-epimerase [candidate division SR1 bacterium]
MTFKFTQTGIDGLVVISPQVFGDERGFFMETYNEKEFKESGISTTFVQDNHSKSKKGVLRGLHFQQNNPQAKLVRVIAGSVYDVAVDLRKGSLTFGKRYGVVLSAENKSQFFIPRGFGHGFLTLEDGTEFVYKCDNLYDPSDEGGILRSDSDLNINWNDYVDVNEVIVSEKDSKNQSFKIFSSSF